MVINKEDVFISWFIKSNKNLTDIVAFQGWSPPSKFHHFQFPTHNFSSPINLKCRFPPQQGNLDITVHP